jgi:hypothetical protein
LGNTHIDPELSPRDIQYVGFCALFFPATVFVGVGKLWVAVFPANDAHATSSGLVPVVLLVVAVVLVFGGIACFLFVVANTLPTTFYGWRYQLAHIVMLPRTRRYLADEHQDGSRVLIGERGAKRLRHINRILMYVLLAVAIDGAYWVVTGGLTQVGSGAVRGSGATLLVAIPVVAFIISQGIRLLTHRHVSRRFEGR